MAQTGNGDVEPKRRLTDRHVQFIAIGGAIGAGLFLGSGSAIAAAGPAVILTYAVAGFIVFLMARALGELTLNLPPVTSFTDHVEQILGGWAGFVSGWSYWLIWVLVGIAELTASGVFVRFWFPQIPQWTVALAVLLTLYTINRLAVRLFGEIEFWLTSIKIAAIVALIVLGLGSLLLGIDTGDRPSAFANLWTHGGFMPLGIAPLIAAIPAGLFAFGGTELIGITAAETGDPDRTVPRAVNGVVLRILLFYIGSLTVVMAVIPWTAIRPDESPFVVLFTVVGLPAAAAVVNFVVLSAVISSCNSGIYATGRVLRSLAERRHAPAWIDRTDKRGLPAAAITASAIAMSAGVAMNYLFPDRVFGIIMSLVAALLLWTWGAIAVAHLRYRRSRTPGSLRFAMPLHPVGDVLVLAFVVGVAVMLWLTPATRETIYAAAAWLMLLSVCYVASTRRSALTDEPAKRNRG